MSKLYLDIVSHFNNGKCIYYSYNEVLYAGTFPRIWAKNHKYGTGPKNCEKCNYIGLWNGVFIGYCVNCAINIYKGERGRGLIDYGVENKKETVLKYPSIFTTYLNNVKQEDVGDIRFVNSALLLKERQQILIKKPIQEPLIQLTILRPKPIRSIPIIQTPIIPIYTPQSTNEIKNNNITDIDTNWDTDSDDDTISSIETISDDGIDMDY